MVALTMDDGYRDNLIRLVPLLEEIARRATVFLEAGAVVERRLPWLHALGWLDAVPSERPRPPGRSPSECRARRPPCPRSRTRTA